MNIALPKSTAVFEVGYFAELSSPLGLSGKSSFVFSVTAELAHDAHLKSLYKLELLAQLVNGVQSQSMSEAIQQPTIDGFVTLWTIDLNHVGMGILRFTNTLGKNGQPVKFGGETYFPVPIKAEGFGKVMIGSQSRPTITISAQSLEITSLLIADEGLQGATVTRTRTLARFLDDGEEPNADAHLPTEIYIIDRASEWVAGDYVVEELVNALDLENSYFPKMVMQKNYCQFVYRTWDSKTGKFKYSDFATCPYVGDLCFNKINQTSTEFEDACSKTLAGCRLRFGQNATLPFFGFPAIAEAN